MNKNGSGCETVKGVGCDVTNCKYNDPSYHCCKAEHIKVQSKNAATMGETFCETFSAKGLV